MLKAATFILAGVLALGAMLEIGCRLIAPLDVLIYQDSLNPELRFELKPEARGWKEGVWTEINSQGLRDREIPPEKALDEFRLAVVGDHSTFGLCVPVEKTYVRQLEKFLNVPARENVLTINLSMYHYNMAQKMEILRDRGLKFHPDFIVFQVSREDMNVLNEPFIPWVRLKNFLRSHSHFLRWLMERLFWVQKPPGKPEMIDLTYIRGIFQTLKKLSDQTGICALVLFVPDLSLKDPGLIDNDKSLKKEFRNAGRQIGLHFCDGEEALKGNPPESLLARPDDPYLNARAHRLLAVKLADQIGKILRIPPE